jgi:hypothetical protein
VILAAVVHRYRSLLVKSIEGFGHLQWTLVVAAVALEVGSMASFARMQRRILRSGGLQLTIESMIAITYAGNAIAVSLPLAGSGVGTAFLHRQFSRRGAPRSVSVWALMISGIFSTMAFALVISVGAIASHNLGAELAGVVGVILVIVPLIALRVVTRREGLQDKAVTAAAWVLQRVRRLARKPDDDSRAVIAEFVETMASLRLGRFDVAAASYLAIANWAFDIACLAWSIKAVGLPVPWSALILAWAAGAGAASFNLTPGGLGVVEPALAAALVAAGLPSARAMSAVLLYRLISFWLVLLVGWLAYGLLWRRGSKLVESAVVVTETVVLE